MAVTEKNITCVYFVTTSYTIHSIGGDWDTFARENGAPDLTADHVVNRQLWDFISGTTVKHLYHAILTKVFKSGKPITIPYRCDSPNWRRVMKLRVMRSSRDLCELISSTIAIEPRPEVEILNSHIERSDFWLPICSWCKKIAVDEYRWVEAEDAEQELMANGCFPYPMLVHDGCPDCLGLMNDALE